MPKPKIKSQPASVPPQPHAQPMAQPAAQWPAAPAGSLPSLPGAAGPWAIMPEALKGLAARIAMGGPEQAGWLDDAFGAPSMPSYTMHGDVAVVAMRDVLTKRATWWTTGMETVQASVQSALDDPAVRAVLLSIDSPGGTVDGTRQFADWLAARAGSVKPIAAYADGTMCSAAYWIGASTGRVFAPGAAIVGSIGVLWPHWDYSAMLAEYGVKVTYVVSGSRKAAGAPELPLSDSDKAYFQHLSDTAYAQFLDGVAPAMGLDRAAPAAWADGQVFRATEAVGLGLVTAIVPDITGAVAALSQEVHMDAKELAAKHPEVVAEIRREAEAATRTAMEQEQAKAVEGAHNGVLDMVAALCGEDAAAKVRELHASGVNAAQLAAMAKAGLLASAGGSADARQGKGDAEGQGGEKAQGTTAQERILSGLLESASATPVKPGAPVPQPKGGDRVASLIEQSKQIPKR